MAQKLLVITAALWMGAVGSPAGAEEGWPHWTGPNQDRISLETNLPDNWSDRGGPESNLLWKSEELAGISTPVIHNGKLYTIARHLPGTEEEGEKIVCADAASGEIIWEHPFNVYLSDVPDTRVGWSNCTADPETGRIYALSVCGYFLCLEGETGDLVWDRSLHEEFGLLSTYGGRTNMPVIVDDQVIISGVVIGWGDTPTWGLMAKPAHRFFGFDKANGELRWLNGTRLIPYDTTYSTPTVVPIEGQLQMVFGSGDGAIWGFQPRTGKPLWKYQLSRRGVNASPLVDGNIVYAGHSEENWVGTAMGRLVALDVSQLKEVEGEPVPSPAEVWDDPHYQVMAGKTMPLKVGNRLYIAEDGAKLRIFEADSGEQVARLALGVEQRSSPLYADGKIYITTNDGRWYILRPTDKGVDRVSRGRIARVASPASPIAADGRVYLPTTGALYCIGLNEIESDAPAETQDVSLKRGEEADVSSDQTPALAQVIPYEVLLQPGGSQEYRVHLFNKRGQFLREAKVDEVSLSADGAGTFEGTTLHAADDGQHNVGLIKCQVAGLESTARFRVVPPLPWRWDFDDMQDVPLTWVGGRVRYVLQDDPEGGKVMVKPTELPTRPGQDPTKLGTKSRCWMGPTDLQNYTISADAKFSAPNGILPDFGLINSRYTMILLGENRELRLYSWATHDYRAQAVVPMAIEPGVWYQLKCRVEQQDGKAVVQGKFWKRGDEEPADWTIQMVDNSPNGEGSPGLYGKSTDSEIAVDNISVVPNEN